MILSILVIVCSLKRLFKTPMLVTRGYSCAKSALLFEPCVPVEVKTFFNTTVGILESALKFQAHARCSKENVAI